METQGVGFVSANSDVAVQAHMSGPSVWTSFVR